MHVRVGWVGAARAAAVFVNPLGAYKCGCTWPCSVAPQPVLSLTQVSLSLRVPEDVF
jgi:hypothetical protein